MTRQRNPALSITSAERVDLLGLVPPLKGLSPEQLDELAVAMRTRLVTAGDVVVAEGEEDRAMYVIAAGHARVVRSGVLLGRLGRGEHFGEITLVVGGKRTASVIAETDCVLLTLGESSLDELTEAHPRLVLALLREVVASTSAHLARMNESVSLLLQERALPRRVDVQVRVGDETKVVRTGAPLADLLPDEVDGVPVVAGLVDGRARSLTTPIVGACAVAPLTTAHWEGDRVYRRSLALATIEAARQVGIVLTAGPSLGFAQQLSVQAPPPVQVAAGQQNQAIHHVEPAPTQETAEAVQAALGRLVASDSRLYRERLSVVEAIAYFESEQAHATVRLLQTTRRRTVAVVSYGEVFAIEAGPLLPRTSMLRGCQLIADGDHLLLVFGVPGHARTVPPGTSDTERRRVLVGAPAIELAQRLHTHYTRMTGDQQRWLKTLQVRNVGEFNSACIGGGVDSVIHVAEGYHEKRIGKIADTIAERRDSVRLISIAGPSSSGKTTFIRRLSVQMQVNGLRPVALGLDDYYVDRAKTPRGEDGDFDFESLEALQLPLLQDHLARLTAGETVQTARFDFQQGKSYPAGGSTMQLGGGDLLLVEGIHGLNPKLVQALAPDRVFRIFVCPLMQLPVSRLTQVHASDLRLLRRIVRDRHGRSLSAAETIQRWPSVRRGERLHIFPYEQHADAVFDSSLVYELAVLKVFAERYLLEVPSADPAQVTAERLLDVVDSWVTIYPDHVPPTSILREFIGGSGFVY